MKVYDRDQYVWLLLNSYFRLFFSFHWRSFPLQSLMNFINWFETLIVIFKSNEPHNFIIPH